MPIYKPSELSQFLEGLGINPKKALSQNFLIDGNILRKIVALANIQPGDIVVEIGPGPGALTECLLEAGAKVFAIEKDFVLGESLWRFKEKHPLLEVQIADILEFPLQEELSKRLLPGQKAKVIANLPYHITTPIIAQLVEMHNCISELIVMVQDEVAKRFVGKPGPSDYSSLTVFLNFFTRPRYGFKVGKNCFYPVPKVDSAVAQLTLHPPPKVSHQSSFFQMVRQAFNHRRKMLRSSLKELYPSAKIEAALAKIHKSITSRPEELSLPELISLFEVLNKP